MASAPPTANHEAVTTLQTAGEGSISALKVGEMRARFEGSSSARMAQNAVCKHSVDEVAQSRGIVTTSDATFSHVLDDWAATNQKATGRCWMFAGLNLLRVGAMQEMNLKEFEFSQNYTFFWDKLERANYFLERVIETADRDVDDRHVAFLMSRPLDDGGQWNMFVSLIEKYGLVPQSAMPETESSSNSRKMNQMLLSKLREGARMLRSAAATGDDLRSLRILKEQVLEVVHRMLAIHLGTPPSSFDWQWMDKDREFHRDGEMTPLEFAKKYVTVPVDEYVCIVHDPRPTSPIGKTFTVECLGNVEGGELVKYLNVDIDAMKHIAMRTIMAGEPVWMGCDVGKMMERKLGLWDAKLYDYESVYDCAFTLDKAERLQYHQTQMTHAMLFTGVDVHREDGQDIPRRWRVENSWGDKSGNKGFYTMNDNWFDQYMFEISARREYVPDNLLSALDEDPIVLPPWDPMGALAGEIKG